ncbi:Cof-type HAD-IIB family hydrolase [Carnobacterium gallinarum]|uniref:Cof-type HAD-IIB family hydrolase n=1 Tax=Carnobacterium gallinarum TaxID=2749 RepID=UPI000554DB8C|nr:Cof-type HAD-IIB family hydrolase [Carnobacterium gallinarum]
MIKLIAIDIDGTLLTSEHQLSENVCLAIQAAKNQGVKIVLCTGRPIVGVMPYLEKLGLREATDIAITQNGALVQETASEKVLSHLTIELNQLKKIEQFAKNQKAQLTFFDDQHMYSLHPEPSQLVLDDAKILHTDLRQVTREELTEEMLLTKAMFLGTPLEIDHLLADLPTDFLAEFYCVRSVPYNFEFLNPAASKGEALRLLAESLNLTAEEVMAIGDAENDRSMLEYAGNSVVMANALPEIQALATFVTKSNDESGVAYAIEELVLKK